MKVCVGCGSEYPPEMFRCDPSKRDGRYPRCRGCTAANGWASFVNVVRRRPCGSCGQYFTPRHNKGQFVRHCSRGCSSEAGRREGSASWRGDDIRYGAAHYRVREIRGPAADQQCVDCGDDAAQWSVNREAKRLRFQNGMPYSPDPADYEPRCVPCHKLYDLGRAETSGVGWPD